VTIRKSAAVVASPQAEIVRNVLNGTGGGIDFYTGAKPATAATAATGTLVCSVPTAGFFATASVNGSFANTTALASNNAVAGTIGYARYRNTANTTCVDEDVYDSAAVPGTGGIGITGGTVISAGTVLNFAIGVITYTEPLT
jgi:hypothetical protein